MSFDIHITVVPLFVFLPCLSFLPSGRISVNLIKIDISLSRAISFPLASIMESQIFACFESLWKLIRRTVAHLVTGVASRLQRLGVMPLAVHLVIVHAVRQVHEELFARGALEAAGVKIELKLRNEKEINCFRLIAWITFLTSSLSFGAAMHISPWLMDSLHIWHLPAVGASLTKPTSKAISLRAAMKSS